MEWHELSSITGFRCRPDDMRETREDRRDRRQESEANRFAIILLALWPYVDPLLSSAPELRDAQRMRDTLDISLEAAVRHMINRRDERLAAVFSKAGRVRYLIRGQGFPWIGLKKGDPLPRMSAAHRAVSNDRPGFTEMAETPPLVWIDRSNADLWEQTRVGKNRTAITLLETEVGSPDTDEKEALAELGPPRFR